MVTGFQEEDSAGHPKVLAYLKHFTMYNGPRQFAMFRRNATTVQPSSSALPCSPLCEVRWADEIADGGRRNRKWNRVGAKARKGLQRHKRPQECAIAEAGAKWG